MIRKKRGRSLTLRQQRRIVDGQKRREGVSVPATVRGGESPSPVHGGADEGALQGGVGDEERGLVVAHFGLNVEVEDRWGGRCRCAVRKSVDEEPVCGDWVVWRRVGEGQGVICGVQARTSLLKRPLSYRRLQTVAANVDRIFVVSVATDLNFGLLDRYLVAAGVAGIEALIVVNKVDLVENVDALVAQFSHYCQMGYRVFFTSIVSFQGMSELLGALAGHLSVFVGQSGVGKSSLAAHWITATSLRVGCVNPESGKGRHTTTVASLYHLLDGGSLIDSPGVREFGLFGVSADDVGRYFIDIVAFFGQCRFSDCRHADEPSCAVQQAVADGRVHPARLKSLQAIQASLQREKKIKG